MEIDQEQPKLGWDQNKYDVWFQAAEAGEYTPTVIVNRRGMAEILDVSTQTIDNLIHKGAPVLRRGQPLQIDTAAFIQFYLANRAGMTVEEYRELELKEIRAMKERALLEALQRENADLKQQLEAMRQELAQAK